MALAVVRDLREQRTLAGPEEVAEFETDARAGFDAYLAGEQETA